MSISVLVVDDSSFFRRQITKLLESDPDIKVIDVAIDGKDAVTKVKVLKPDVVTMDVEMPVMDGITAVKKIMEDAPTAILMFSSLTVEGAKSTLQALEAGALDYLPKRFEDIARDKDKVAKVLIERVKALARGGQVLKRTRQRGATVGKPAAPVQAAQTEKQTVKAVSRAMPEKSRYAVIAIGTSTGGPAALQTVLTQLPKDLPAPVIIVQHMPGSFTPAFAERLDSICALKVKEASEGDILQAGTVYLAPGGKQMLLGKRSTIHIEGAEEGQTYKPSVDVTFTSIAENFSDNVLAIVLTGMGADGCLGAKKLKQKGATVWAQDESSSVIYGMPHAIVEAKLADDILPLDDVANKIIRSL